MSLTPRDTVQLSDADRQTQTATQAWPDNAQPDIIFAADELTNDLTKPLVPVGGDSTAAQDTMEIEVEVEPQWECAACRTQQCVNNTLCEQCMAPDFDYPQNEDERENAQKRLAQSRRQILPSGHHIQASQAPRKHRTAEIVQQWNSQYERMT